MNPSKPHWIDNGLNGYKWCFICSSCGYMDGMFYESEFNGDISKWNVSKVENMDSMFKGSKFNGNISKWNVLKVENMENMFCTHTFRK